MEGLIASDGERVLKSGLLGFGALMWAAPLVAQASPDPLAPLPATPQATQPAAAPQTPPSSATQSTDAQAQPQQPIVVSQSAPPPRTIVVPKDWRGVFDAIDAGQWASAR